MVEVEPKRLALDKIENTPISAVAAKRKLEELQQQEREDVGQQVLEAEEVDSNSSGSGDDLDGFIDDGLTSPERETEDSKPKTARQIRAQAKLERQQARLARRRERKEARLTRRAENGGRTPKRAKRAVRKAAAAAADTTSLAYDGADTVPSIGLRFTSFPPDSDMILSDYGRAVDFRLDTGHELVIAGEYLVQVLEGEFSVMGVVLRPGMGRHLVYAPLLHAVPVIKCLAGSPTASSGGPNIAIYHSHSGISVLRRVSSLFRHLWQGQKATSSNDRRSFTLLHSQQDLPIESRNGAAVIEVSKEWKDDIYFLTERANKSPSPPVVVVAGPKSAGKSTFCRLLTNSIITNRVSIGSGEKGVIFLDLDPGQPEFSPPCQVSLYHLKLPTFGPPFSHPAIDESTGNRQLRSHHLGFDSPKENPGHYLACVADLTAHYRNFLLANPMCPLIINTAGWTRGVGIDLLLGVLERARAEHLVWISPSTHDPDLRDLKRFLSRTMLHELPSPKAKKIGIESGSLRAMQTLSYFHLNSELAFGVEPGRSNPRWDATPLTHRKPWIVEYSGPNPGILAVAILGETLSSDWLPIAINGTIVAIVVIEDDSALSTASDAANATNEATHDGDDMEGESEPEKHSFGIEYGPQFKIPYLPLPNGQPLDPTKTRCVGLAIVRGIDAQSGSLHLLTNVDPGKLPSGDRTVLVRGRAALPVCAYVEASPSVFTEKEPSGPEGLLSSKSLEIPYVTFDTADKKNKAPGIRTREGGWARMDD